MLSTVSAKIKIAAALIFVSAVFGFGYKVAEWRYDAIIANTNAELAEARAVAVGEGLAKTKAMQEAADSVSALLELKREAAKVQERVIVKEVVRYEKAPYAGKCQLNNHWVRTDTAAALGLPVDTSAASGNDDAPSGFTDIDALSISTQRSAICRAEIDKLEILQQYVRDIRTSK